MTAASGEATFHYDDLQQSLKGQKVQRNQFTDKTTGFPLNPTDTQWI